MRASRARTPVIGIRCDAGPTIGVGHLARCHALAEELLGRGAQVEFFGDLGGVGWALELAARTPAAAWSPAPAPGDAEALAALATRRGLDAIVLDSYALAPRCAGRLREAGITVLAVVDGDTRGQHADLFLDQNLGAEEPPLPVPPGAVRLAGAPYVMLRDAVRRLRPPVPREASDGPPAMLCVFGGTDAAGVAPDALRLAVSTGAAFSATVIAASEAIAADLRAVRPAPGQSVTIVPPTHDLPRLALGSDLVLSAAGSSTWEMLSLGIPTALVMVADNQRSGYDVTVSRGLAAGLGDRSGLQASGSDAAAVLHGLLTEPARRTALARLGHASIDGRGRERVADALYAALHEARHGVSPGASPDKSHKEPHEAHEAQAGERVPDTAADVQ